MDPITIALGLAKVVPGIVRWIGGDNAGDVADKVVQIAREVTGAATPGGALSAIQKDPDIALQFEKALMGHERELEKMFLDDRQDARARDVAMRQAGYKNSRADAMVVVAFLALCFVIWAIWSKADIPDGVLAIFNMIIGALLKMIGDAFAFEFGSSRGSKEKTIHLQSR